MLRGFTRLQALVRAVLARERIDKQWEVEDMAAIAIQKAYREWVIMNRDNLCCVHDPRIDMRSKSGRWYCQIKMKVL